MQRYILLLSGVLVAMSTLYCLKVSIIMILIDLQCFVKKMFESIFKEHMSMTFLSDNESNAFINVLNRLNV